jgi:PDDEXK-like domain of unknown function (DUF3799)
LEPGIYFDLSNADYHAAPGLSNSGMKHLAVSDLHFWHQVLNPEREPEEEKPHLALGHALHGAVLEPDKFDSRYVCAIDTSDWPVCLDTVKDIRSWVEDRGGKCKGTSKDDVIASAQDYMRKIGESVPILQIEETEFLKQNEGKTIIPKDEWKRLAGMATALSNEESLRPLLGSGKPEVSVFVKDPETGVLLKMRMDWMAMASVSILDVKTFSQMRGKSIDRSVCDAIYYEGYWKQAWLYCLIYFLHFGKMPEFIFAFVESQEPYEVRIKKLTPKSRFGLENTYWQSAGLAVRRLIERYADCMEKYGPNKPWREPQGIEGLVDEDVQQLVWRRE